MSVPDAKFTKGEFQVSMPTGPWECRAGRNHVSCWQLGGVGLAQNSLTLEPLLIAIVDGGWACLYQGSIHDIVPNYLTDYLRLSCGWCPM